ncbi:MAG TPA: response regulator [Terracidiphilus sp.]
MTSAPDEIRDTVDRSASDSVNISAQQSNHNRILCVDDEILGTTLRAEILREEGYSVVVYHSPLEVLRCDLTMFDLAILDFQMPGLNGREVLLRMRAFGARFPIVLLTGIQKFFLMKIVSYLRDALTRVCLFDGYSTRSPSF